MITNEHGDIICYLLWRWSQVIMISFKGLMHLAGGSGKLWGGVHVKHYNYFTSKPLRRFTFAPSITIISHQNFNCFPVLFPPPAGISLSEEMCRSTIICPSAPFGHLYLLYTSVTHCSAHLYLLYTSDTLHVTHCSAHFRIL